MPNAQGNFLHYLVVARGAQGERDLDCADVPLLHYFLLIAEICIKSDSAGFKIALKLIFLKYIPEYLQKVLQTCRGKTT